MYVVEVQKPETSYSVGLSSFTTIQRVLEKAVEALY